MVTFFSENTLGEGLGRPIWEMSNWCLSYLQGGGVLETSLYRYLPAPQLLLLVLFNFSFLSLHAFLLSFPLCVPLMFPYLSFPFHSPAVSRPLLSLSPQILLFCINSYSHPFL